jgi:Flp pilus assembly protein TadB
MLVPFILAVWVAIGAREVLRRRREGRPGSSVVSFRQQLSTLERATPGHSLRLSTTGPVPVVRSTPSTTPRQTKRRRDILGGLGASTLIFLVLAVVLGGTATILFVVSAVALGAYVCALVQMRKRAAERQAKVRVLRPRVSPRPTLALRTTASN